MAIDVDRYHFQSLCAMAQANRDFTKHVAALVFDRPIARGNSCFNPTWRLTYLPEEH